VVAPAPWTLPSHVSIFTGLDAMRHGFNFWGTAPASLEMIAETLRGEGYSTAAITGGGVMLPQFGYAQGFDSFAHWTQPDSSGEIDWAFGLATEWLESNRDRRFFLFLHTYEIHFPHRRREPYFSEFADRRGSDPPGGEIDLREREWKNLQFPGLYFLIKRPGADTWAEPLTDAEIDLVGLMYDSAIRKADDHVRRLLDRLDALGLTDDTVVILTSDHGEELGDDRGRAGHAYVSEANVLVPLYIARPGGAGAGAVIDRQVRLIDLQPTILDLVGVAPPFATDGRSLVPLLEGRTAEHPTDAWTYAASSNLGLALRRDEDLKYLFPNAAWSELAEREELYDLGADPGEDNNLAGDDDRLPDLRALAGETILEQHRGYRLEIRNGGRRALAGKLTGLWATHDRVKTADHGCRCVSNPKRSPPSFVVPGGRSTVLLFEGLAGSDVGLEGRLLAPDGTESASFDLSFDLNLVSTPAVIVRRGDDWVLVEDHDTGIETGFILTRHGPDDQVSESPDTAADTLEQLRALGYVQ
jgi:arylsulfatase A-like enzyme